MKYRVGDKVCYEYGWEAIEGEIIAIDVGTWSTKYIVAHRYPALGLQHYKVLKASKIKRRCGNCCHCS